MALATLVLGCGSPLPPPPPPLPAVLATTVRLTPEPAIARRGAVEAGARLRLGFNTPGVISEIRVKTGDVVAPGQLIARLKDTDAAAALRAAQVTRARARRELRIAETLLASGAGSPDQRDTARYALDLAEANVALAAEALAQRRLVSPIGGTVLVRLAEPGEAVGPGAPVLVIEGTQRLVVKLGVSERELQRVTPGQPVTLGVDGLAESIPARITSVAPAPGADGLYAVEVTPDGGEHAALHPGLLVAVRFGEDESRPSVRVPLDAIVYRDDKAWVFVLTGEAGALTAERSEVVVDRWDGKDAIVRSALADGDRIVSEGAYFLQHGQGVRVLAGDPEAPAATASRR